MSSEKLNKNSGHRERLRKRFEKSGFDGFNDYEVLELMLTYAIPRKDTKDIAKNLLKRFKTLQGILSADIKELIKVEGLGKHSVIFLKVLSDFIKFYFEHQVEKAELQFTTLEQVVTYLRGVIGNYRNEVVKVIYLNSNNNILFTELLSEGSLTESYLNPRRIVETALKYNSTSVIIAHNHPDGVAEPSEYDDIITKNLYEALKLVEIILQDHIIIADNSYYSYKQQGGL